MGRKAPLINMEYILGFIGVLVSVVALIGSWGFFFLWGMNFEKVKREKQEIELENRSLNRDLIGMAGYYGIGEEE